MKSAKYAACVLALSLVLAGGSARADWKTVARDIGVPIGMTGVGVGLGYALCVGIPVPGNGLCLLGVTAAGLASGVVTDVALHLREKKEKGAESVAVEADARDAKTISGGSSTGAAGAGSAATAVFGGAGAPRAL